MLDTRNRFFAQYWGVKCMYVGGVGLVVVGNGGWNLKHPDFFLELKPLIEMHDNDAVQYFDILFSKIASHKDKPRDFKIEFGKEWAESIDSEKYGLNPADFINGVDFLRSKGYAVPFMNYSVKDLVELGWVKLDKNKKL